MQDLSTVHETQVSTVADQAFGDMTRGAHELYVYFAPCRLVAANDAPGVEWRLAINQRVPGSLTRDQLRAWIAERTRSIPYLIEEEAGK